MKLSYFGELDADALEEFYEINTEVEGRQIAIELNFDDGFIAEDRLLKVNRTLENLPAFVAKLKGFIHDDFKTGEDVQEFLDFHFDELGEDLDPLLSTTDQSLEKDEQLLSVVKLRRIGFYPEEDEGFIIADFGIDEELSQYLLVVYATAEQELNYIAMES